MNAIQQAVLCRLELLRDELSRYAAVRAAHLTREIRDNAALTGYWSLRVSIAGRKGKQWTLTDDELEMDPDSLDEWEQVVRDDCARLCTPDPEAEQFTSNARTAMALAEEHFRRLRMEQGLSWRSPSRPPRPADRKARELFIRTAGMHAYQELNAGRGLPVRGSTGTAYALHKKGSFCLTNLATEVKYCAVVPGVPLWDHLLGVKLMVEHDEPRLLAVANSSIGRVTYGGFYANNQNRGV